MGIPAPPIFRRGALLLAVFMVFSGTAFAQTEHKTLDLKKGGSDLIKTSYPFKRVSIADPEVADVVVLSPTEIYVFGKKVGYTSIMLWEEGKGKTLVDVVVSLDLTGLKEKLHQLYPDQQIKVYGSETGVVLSGTVSGPEIVDQVLRLTKNFLPKEAAEKGGKGGTGRSGMTITNLLKVGGIQQVMLEVKFAEVSRDSGKDWQAALGQKGLGNFSGAASSSGSVLTPLNITETHPSPALLADGSLGSAISGTVDGIIQNPGSLLLNFTGNPANVFVNISNFTAALNLLETEGMARILAEPRLVTQSGQEASFLAGGEFPIPVPQTGAAGGTTITIKYKEFGVALRFTPVVLSDGKISLRVAPSVSEIASVSQIPAGITGANFNVPNLNTRKLKTTVQLYDGQTLALAGLLQDNLRENVKKIPGLADIPILGQLFRSTGYTHNKTDLLVAVTPHLVKPVKEGSLQFPGEKLREPSAFEFYLEGRLEGYGRPDEKSAFGQHHFGGVQPLPGEQGGLEGQFGTKSISGQ
jgi:pilus assembly protein CpaC